MSHDPDTCPGLTVRRGPETCTGSDGRQIFADVTLSAEQTDLILQTIDVADRGGPDRTFAVHICEAGASVGYYVLRDDARHDHDYKIENDEVMKRWTTCAVSNACTFGSATVGP